MKGIACQAGIADWDDLHLHTKLCAWAESIIEHVHIPVDRSSDFVNQLARRTHL